MYAMGMLVGAYIIRFVPEVASWLIPGGVSSSAGSAAGGVVAGVVGWSCGQCRFYRSGHRFGCYASGRLGGIRGCSSRSGRCGRSREWCKWLFRWRCGYFSWSDGRCSFRYGERGQAHVHRKFCWQGGIERWADSMRDSYNRGK